MGQGKTTQTNEGPTKTGTQNGKKDKMQPAKEQQKQAEPVQGDRNKSQPTGTRGKQEANHADRRCVQENEGTKNTARVYDHG
jgi:hypothetical protein